tara:strand:+ start:574 stop:903 length:330 start_codon:yes stop_codon:yes gene_type:complete
MKHKKHKHAHKAGKSSNLPFMEIVKIGAGLTIGSVSASVLILLYSVTFLALGGFILVYFNKEETPLFEELQFGQYFGIFFCFLGLLPFLQYFLIGFLLEGGKALGEEVF